MNRAKLWAIVLAVGLMLVFPWAATAADEAPRLDKDTLKAWLSDPQVIILDVRQPKDWNSSTKKIKGAVRQDPQADLKTWPALPKDKKLVLYCA